MIRGFNASFHCGETAIMEEAVISLFNLMNVQQENHKLRET